MDASGTSIELTLLGYQFPLLELKTPCAYDLNWLDVRIDAKNEDGSWSEEDSALLTWDVAALAHWFRALSRRQSVRQLVDFTEPHLRFGCRSRTADPVRLRIDVAYKFCPQWGESRILSGPYYGLDLEVSREQLATIASELETQLGDFPPREMSRSQLDYAIWCCTSPQREVPHWRSRRSKNQ